MESQTFANVWDALSESPSEAASMRARSDLLIALQDRIVGWGLTQAEAASRLGITQPRLNDLLRGRIGKFSLDALVNLSTRAGLSVRVDVQAPAEAAA